MAEKEKNIKKSKFIGFFKGIAQELKKVTWPTGKQLFKSTVTVLVVCAIVAVIISLFDWGLSSLIKLLVNG
ncbi:MAG: preprotein translocase subunit SecE [Clostridia bacterium]|jgi:preprotein translocase subunit SecE|nr:preprotein translocase subunit SecE [Clostridia bacterium]NLV33514.1 preprotein translocase subunit SecE [Clostridiaceae bacterium]HQM96362.1 preprotein translocase subunit SecE [Clostridia bacterium]HQO69824.1 preprotein translocase subunit SecE [Clostridia bacterium]